MIRWYRGGIAVAMFAAVVLFAAGCDKPAAPSTKEQPKPVDNKTGSTPVAKDDSKHSGWWCDEHGMPEKECSMCSAKVAAEFKKKGGN